MTPRTDIILRAACMALFVVFFANTIYVIASMPLFYRRAISQTLPEPTISGINQVGNQELERRASIRGMTVEQYIIYRVTLDTFYSLSFYIISLLIVRRAKGQWFLWFTALVLFFIPGGQQSLYLPLDWNLTRLVGFGASFWAAFPLLLFLFPNGKAEPRWMCWLIGPLLILFFGFFVTAGVANIKGLDDLFQSISKFAVIPLLSIPLALGAQIYRYFRVSTREERQQTKWVLGGLVVFVLSTQILSILFRMTNNLMDYGFPTDVSSLMILFLPITIGISILRYRLYDIDLIIRRTLQYGVLSLLLGLLYYGIVILLGQVIQSTTGQQSPLVIVVSTLVIAALFNPLRRRVQGWIDRQFYRQQYDAVQAVAGFSLTARSQIELEGLANRLVDTVRESLQPENVSVWIRKDTR